MYKILHGIDLTNIKRKEFNNLDLVTRVLHPVELEQYNQLIAPHQQKQYIAKIWAIKEALFKAYNYFFGMNKFFITFVNQHISANLDNILFTISVSYCDDFVIASAMAIVK